MDFDDTPQEAVFRAEARAWLEKNAEPRSVRERTDDEVDLDNPETIARSKTWQAKKAAADWACITWPKEFGGRGASSSQSVIWRQEESRFNVPPNIFSIGQGIGGPTLMAHGTREQQQRWLPRMLSGEEVWCQLFSETSAGSDLAALRMSAVRDGNDWVVNGHKVWTTGAHFCKWGTLLTRTDPNVGKHSGLTFFVVDMTSPGVEIRPIKQITGGHDFNEVYFTDCRIPDSNRVSGVGNGWAVAVTTLMNERSSAGAMGGGTGVGFQHLLELARQTRIGEQRAIDDGGIQERLANFYVQKRGIEFTSFRSQTALSRGQTPGPENSLGKLVNSRMRQEMASFALELQGITGSLMPVDSSTDRSAAWQEAYLFAPGMRIAGGTDEILRNIIAERVLGLPAEPRLDKGIAFRDVPTS